MTETYEEDASTTFQCGCTECTCPKCYRKKIWKTYFPWRYLVFWFAATLFTFSIYCATVSVLGYLKILANLDVDWDQNPPLINSLVATVPLVVGGIMFMFCATFRRSNCCCVGLAIILALAAIGANLVFSLRNTVGNLRWGGLLADFAVVSFSIAFVISRRAAPRRRRELDPDEYLLMSGSW